RMYIDKLNGGTSQDSFDRMSDAFRKEQRDTLQKIEQHQSALRPTWRRAFDCSNSRKRLLAFTKSRK
ncbi:MAG TPA: hypothetical protein VE735_01345, partial [Gammaproteobacteria bacterium]|nr:hypothetical protein [Gammaproteobacteria bacterium]